MSNEEVTFGRYLRRLRQLRGLSQYRFCQLLKADKSYVSRLENNYTLHPHRKTLDAITAVLQLTTEEHETLVALASRIKVTPTMRTLIVAAGRLSDAGLERLIQYAEELYREQCEPPPP